MKFDLEQRDVLTLIVTPNRPLHIWKRAFKTRGRGKYSDNFSLSLKVHKNHHW